MCVAGTLVAGALSLAIPASASAVTVYTLPQSTTLGYFPSSVTIGAGEAVTYTNYDVVTHDITSVKTIRRRNQLKPLFSTALIGFADSAPVRGIGRLRSGRTYDFYCSLHPSMEGKLRVR